MRNGETDLRDGDGLVELAGADVLDAGAGVGGVLVLRQPHVPRRVATARLRHGSPPLLASLRPPRVLGCRRRGRAARWERVRVVEIWVGSRDANATVGLSGFGVTGFGWIQPKVNDGSAKHHQKQKVKV